MKRMVFRRRLAHSIIWLAIISHVIGAIVGLVRIYLQIYWVGHYSKVINVLVVLLCLLLFVSGRMRIDSFGLLVLTMIAVASWTGGVWGNGNVFFLSHLFSGIFIVALYVAMSNYAWSEEEVDAFVAQASFVLVSVFAIVIGLFWILFLFGRQLYLGISTNILILPLAHAALQRRLGGVLLTSLLILVAGKRASYANFPVTLLLLIPQYYGRSIRRGQSTVAGILSGSGRRMLAAATALVLVAVGGLLVVAVVDLSDVPLIGNVVDKWRIVNPFIYGFDIERLNLGSGQRIYEITYSWREFSSSAWYWLIGRGYGWTYESPIFWQGTFESHYVHFSPLNLIYEHGLLLGGLFFLLLAYKTVWIGSRLSAAGGGGYALWITFVGLLVTGLFGYSYGTDPTIWLVLGILTSRSRLRAAESTAPGHSAQTP